MKKRRSPFLKVLLAITLVVLLVLVAAYFYMIGLRPNIARPELGPSARAEIQALEGRLRAHVTMLAETIGERHFAKPASLARAADYIEAQLAGYARVSRERFRARGVDVCNVVAEIDGEDDSAAIVLLGAHYDSAQGTPGADDNATGVAALLEVGRALARTRGERPVRLVAFVNEEPPFFRTELMGSFVHARACKEAGTSIHAMLALEMLGCYSHEDGSQRYPSPFSIFYPSRGDFVAFVGKLGSRSLVRTCLAHFMKQSDFPAEGLATFASLPGIDFSDHRSFWRFGYPGVMVTDTAFFRNAHYHADGDRASTLDFASFARVTHGILGVARGLRDD